MYRQQSRKTKRPYRNGYLVLLILLILSSLVFVGATLQPTHTADTGDLLNGIPVVDERTLNSAACGIAAATMVLDYYLPQSGPIHQAIDIAAVSKYVKQFYGYDKQTKTMVPEGTSYDQLQTGIDAASTAPELNIGVPLNASWHTTDNTHWFSVLQSELDAKRPIILFIPNGHSLGWNWNYGHFIVVSGYTSDNSIIYHDPWGGKPNTLSYNTFATAWGATWNGNAAWQYMTITGTPIPTNFAPFVGTWYAHAQQLVINADGKAVYTGRVFVWCVDYQGNTVSPPPCDGGGYQGINPNQNALITFNSVIGNTASGTIMLGGTGMRSQDDSRSLIPIGSTVTITLNPNNNTLNVSNGMLLCGPQAIKNNVDPGCNSGA